MFSIHFKIYLWPFVNYHHLQKYFCNWNITLNTVSSVKSISGVTWSGKIGSTTCPYSAHTINFPVFNNYRLLKTLCAYNTNDHVLQNFEVFFLWWVSFCLLACGKEISIWKYWWFFFGNLELHNSRFYRKVFIPWKIVGLWFKFSLLRS